MNTRRLQRLADRHQVSVRITYFPHSEEPGDRGVWDITVKPRSGSPTRIRDGRAADHIHYTGFDLPDVIAQAVVRFADDFEQGGRS